MENIDSSVPYIHDRLTQGTIVHGSYRLSSLCGESALSHVWSAVDTMTSKQVILKFLKAEIISPHESDKISFQREIVLISGLRHRNIVPVLGSFMFYGRPVIAMERVPGYSLESFLVERPVLSWQTAVAVAVRIADALSFSHAAGVCHLYLNPGNIFVDDLDGNPSVVLTDFAVSHIIELLKVEDEEEIGHVFGYISPEMAGIIKSEMDERSDLYSLGVLLFRILCGRMPFVSTDVDDLLRRHASELPVSVSSLNAEVPSGLADIVARLLMKDPSQRYATAALLRDDLTALLNNVDFRPDTAPAVVSEDGAGSLFDRAYRHWLKADYHAARDLCALFSAEAHNVKDATSISMAEALAAMCGACEGDMVTSAAVAEKLQELAPASDAWAAFAMAQTWLGIGLYAARRYRESSAAFSAVSVAIETYRAEGDFCAYAACFSFACAVERAVYEKSDSMTLLRSLYRSAKLVLKKYPDVVHLESVIAASESRMRGDNASAATFFLDAADKAFLSGRNYDGMLCSFMHICIASADVVSAVHYAAWKRLHAQSRAAGVKPIAEVCRKVLLSLSGSGGSPQERFKRERRIKTLMHANRQLSSIIQIDDLAAKMLEIVMPLCGAERGLLLLYPNAETQNKIFEIKGLCNMDYRDWESEAFVSSYMIIKQVEREKQIKIISRPTTAAKGDPLSVLCAPLILNGYLHGILYVDNRLLAGVFSEDDRPVIESVCLQAAVAVYNARLFDMAAHDGMTRLYNRVFFDNFCRQKVAEARRYGIPLSLTVFDVDLFKSINDTYGHHAGDSVLQKIAEIMNASVRKSDICARFGGDEFLILFPNTDTDGATIVCERIRTAIAQTEFMFSRETTLQPVKVTVSIGLTRYADALDPVGFFKRADEALYRAKQDGRACLRVWHDTVATAVATEIPQQQGE